MSRTTMGTHKSLYLLGYIVNAKSEFRYCYGDFFLSWRLGNLCRG